MLYVSSRLWCITFCFENCFGFQPTTPVLSGLNWLSVGLHWLASLSKLLGKAPQFGIIYYFVASKLVSVLRSSHTRTHIHATRASFRLSCHRDEHSAFRSNTIGWRVGWGRWLSWRTTCTSSWATQACSGGPQWHGCYAKQWCRLGSTYSARSTFTCFQNGGWG